MKFRSCIIVNGLVLLAHLVSLDDGNPEACFAVFEPESETLTFHRIPYDHFTAAEKVRRAGLPEELANSLLTGK